MAIDPNALTLAEWAHLSNDPLVLKITESLHKTLNILQDIPFVTDETMSMKGFRYIDNLPGVNWGQINKAPVVTKGKPTPYEEAAFLIRNQFQIDKRLLNNKNNITNPMQSEVDMFMEALTYELNYRFIANDPTDTVNGNVDAWQGLASRISNSQIPTELNIDGSASALGPINITQAQLSSTTPTVAATAGNQFIEAVQSMLDFMNAPEGDGVVFYCNDLLKRRWERSIRAMGAGSGFDITRDAFDRPIAMYKNAKVRDVGRRVDQVTRVITSNEKANGSLGVVGTDDYTSLYAVRYGDGYFKGWQTNPLKPDNLGVDPTNGIMINLVVDWGSGLWQQHNRSVCRLHGILISP